MSIMHNQKAKLSTKQTKVLISDHGTHDYNLIINTSMNIQDSPCSVKALHSLQ